MQERMNDWYVIQVKAGSESTTKDIIEKLVDHEAYSQVFYPRRKVRRCIKREWKDYLETLFPGYLFVVTSDPVLFANELRKVPRFSRLLGTNDSFSRLSSREIALLQAFFPAPSANIPLDDSSQGKISTQQGALEHDYILDFSYGIKEGNEVIILQGPLMDKMAYVRKIDRHKRVAYVEFELCGRKVLTKLGLEVVTKRDDD